VRRPASFAAATVLVLVSAGAVTAVTASGAVPTSRAGASTSSIGGNDLKPTDCAALTLAGAAVRGSGSFSGTSANELLLGSTGGDGIDGGGGNDCLLGGDGVDTLTGNTGTDVCIGGAGLDVFIGCETQIQ